MTSPRVEIERKFLLDHVPDDLARYPSEEIDQGYLAITEDGVEVRIRRRGERSYLTIKAGAGQTRLEEELEIDQQRFASLWPLTEGKRVQKARHLIPAGDGLKIELDVYGGDLEGLITAEVEFESQSAAAAFHAPAWLGREITDDARYKNQALATRGLPTANP
jgi:adenylate cyclase